MKRYKFQVLVTMGDNRDGVADVMLDSAPHRMVLRGHSNETRHSQIFSALVSCDDEVPFGPHGRQRLVTLRLADDDIADYLESGNHFELWLGGDVGHGVVTRRLFV